MKRLARTSKSALGAAILMYASTLMAHGGANMGACEISGVSGMMIGSKIEWHMDESQGLREAFVVKHGMRNAGQILSIRGFDETGHKVNLEFTDRVLGIMEVVVTLRPSGTRVGAVTFDEVDGDHWVSAIVPFEDAVCIAR